MTARTPEVEPGSTPPHRFGLRSCLGGERGPGGGPQGCGVAGASWSAQQASSGDDAPSGTPPREPHEE
jgi:hypothetical protein